MPSFNELESKFGEIAAQAILENLECFEGVRSTAVTSLEERWQNLMQGNAIAA